MIEFVNNGHPSCLQGLRKDAREIFQAGIDAANPCSAVKRSLSANNRQITIALDANANGKKRQGSWSKIHLIAFGKAACAMATAAQEIIPHELLADKGIVVTNYENAAQVENCDVFGASHPLPDRSGNKAACRIADAAQNAMQGELVLVMVSGGGSALIPYPVAAITLEEKMTTTDLLLGCGATINEINCVRKHLSQLKGGGLARLAFPADLHALILSDVLGDDLSAIASGPTVPDPTSFQQARAVFKIRHIWNQVPKNVCNFLQQGSLGNVPETPKPGDEVFANTGHTLIGSNAISVNATIAAAVERNYVTLLYSDCLCGEARDAAEKLVNYAKQLLDQGLDKPHAILAGGETTVTLKGNGRGGRNQEMTLAFAIAAEQRQLPACWVFLSGGTDGLDGPTDAAGGVVDTYSLERMQQRDVDPGRKLANNDSYNALKVSHDLLETGATGTNVADLQVLLIHP